MQPSWLPEIFGPRIPKKRVEDPENLNQDIIIIIIIRTLKETLYRACDKTLPDELVSARSKRFTSCKKDIVQNTKSSIITHR